MFLQHPQSGEKVCPARGSSPQSASTHSRSSCWKPPLLHTAQLQLQAPACSYFHASSSQCSSQYASPSHSHSSKPCTGEVAVLAHIFPAQWCELLRIEGPGLWTTGFGFNLLSLSLSNISLCFSVLSHQKSRVYASPVSVKIMRSEGLSTWKSGKSLFQCTLELFSLTFFFFFFRNLASSAMLRCANGHPRTLLLLRPPLRRPRRPRAPPQGSPCASCVWIKARSRAPAAAPQTSRKRAMTKKGAGNWRKAGHPASVTLKVITATTAPEAPGGSSSGISGARRRPGAAPLRAATGTLVKSRISHQYRQSKNWQQKDVRIYTWIYKII